MNTDDPNLIKTPRLAYPHVILPQCFKNDKNSYAMNVFANFARSVMAVFLKLL